MTKTHFTIVVGAAHITLRSSRPVEDGKRPVRYIVDVNGVPDGEPAKTLDAGKKHLQTVVTRFGESQKRVLPPAKLPNGMRAIIAATVAEDALAFAEENGMTLSDIPSLPESQKNRLGKLLADRVAERAAQNGISYHFASAQSDHSLTPEERRHFIEQKPDRWLKPLGWRDVMGRAQKYATTCAFNTLREGSANATWR